LHRTNPAHRLEPDVTEPKVPSPPGPLPRRNRDLAVEDLLAAIRPGQRLLGIDLGDKTIGLALSDVECSIATPMKTLVRGKFSTNAAELFALMEKFDTGALVFGLPLNMDGSSGPRVQATRTFARALRNQRDIPVLFWDERLSTVAAERALLSVDLSRAKRAAVIDATAAAFILQGVLDRLRALAMKKASGEPEALW
jgi:putative holliday junction resolvase